MSGRRVLVLGDAVLDGWLTGVADRLCREAPVPVVDVTRTRYAGGGAANTAANLAALGAVVGLVGAVGDDGAADELTSQLRRAGVATRLVRVAGRRTVTKRRVIADGQVVARFDDGDTTPLPGPAAAELVATAAKELAGADAVVVCDYAAGTVPDGVVELLAGARDRLGLLAVDAHDLGRWSAVRPDLVTPSLTEAARLIGHPAPTGPDRVGWAARRLAEVRDAAGAGAVAVTLDVDGTVTVDAAGAVHRTGTVPRPQAQASGAGDSYLAGFVLALLAGAEVGTAAELGQAAADTVLDAPGTAVCSIGTLRDRLTESTVDDLDDIVDAARARGERIVFTNGCFDVLHRGHVRCLAEAARLGDRLIVAVNSDESVRRLKGPSRPVNPVDDRTAVLAALSCVDHVVVFEEDSPAELIRRVRPDVYVKGGDYPPELIPEAELVRGLGGEVRTIDYLPDRSTSAIIDRIRQRSGRAAAGQRTAS